MHKLLKSEKGAIFITVLIISMLTIFIAVGASNMLLQDVHMIKHLKRSMQAQYVAEGGISDALAKIAASFSAKDNPGNFPLTNLGDGTYDVTVTQSGGRVLLSSVGIVEGVSRTVSCEVRSNIASALYNMMSSGANLRLRALNDAWADINGDLHSNNKMWLHTQKDGWMDIDTCGEDCCDGSLSATDSIDLHETTPNTLVYHGSLAPYDGTVTFPTFDYLFYKNLALTGGGEGVDHFSSSGETEFVDATLNPVNGIVYVEGTARFRGTCHVNGGIVADKIIVQGELYQHKAGMYNVVISRTDHLRVMGRLDVEEAVVFAGDDFRIFDTGVIVNITGTLIAKGYLHVWDKKTFITYNHKLLDPGGMLGPEGSNPIYVVSWNR